MSLCVCVCVYMWLLVTLFEDNLQNGPTWYSLCYGYSPTSLDQVPLHLLHNAVSQQSYIIAQIRPSKWLNYGYQIEEPYL